MHLLNRATLENLVKAGAFDEILPNRRRLVEVLTDFVQSAQRLEGDNKQLSLFESAGDDSVDEAGPDIPEVEDYSLYEKLDFEKEVTGLYISGHPFDACEEAVGRLTNCSIADLPCWQGRTPPKVGGILLSATEKTTKKGAAMGQLLLEDSNSSLEMVVFPKTWENIKV